MRRCAEIFLWITGGLLLTIGGAHLLAYDVFQSDPALYSRLARPYLSAPSRTPLVQLQIPSVQMKLTILEGDDDDTLNLAPGHIPSSAPIGSRGNAVIAGHRDIAFRKLRFIKVGDVILTSGTHESRYVVTDIHIIPPEDVSVLAQTPEPQLTLITCFPFYFVGDAPKRFVVQAKKIS